MISSNSYEEVYEILSYMDKVTVMQIPEKILNKIKESRNSNFKTNIDKADIFNEQNISKEAVDLLCWLDYTYWMDKSRKTEIDKISKENYIADEKKKREKYDPEDLFSENTIEENVIPPQNVANMVEYKENIFRKRRN